MSLSSTENISIVVIPYRDSYFLRRFGPCVRDCQFIDELISNPLVQDIAVVNRPVSIIERVFHPDHRVAAVWPGVKTFDSTSYDPIGPAKGRRWAAHAYDRIFTQAVKYMREQHPRGPIVVLDFSPFALLPHLDAGDASVTYWYDMIDNFTKHNRFSSQERNSVRKKYKFVREHYHFVTSVSPAAASALGHTRSLVVPNGLPTRPHDALVNINPTYDFGFVGFITNKLDLKLIRQISEKHSIVFYGRVFDRHIGEYLSSLANVTLKGEFKYAEIRQLIHTFKVGLIPYREDRSHDGSPLKLYEYLDCNRACVTCMDYEVTNEFVLCINSGLHAHVDKINALFSATGDPRIRRSLPKGCSVGERVQSAINGLVDVL